MSAFDQSNCSGGARPKTAIKTNNTNKKDKSEQNHVKYKKNKCDSFWVSIQPNNSKMIKSRKDRILNKIDVDDKTEDQFILEEDLPLAFTEYDIEHGSDLSTSSVKLLRTKNDWSEQFCPGSFSDYSVTGSLLNLSLNADEFSKRGEKCDSFVDSCTEDVSSQDMFIAQQNNNSEDPNALIKWKSAGLALRKLLLQKSQSPNSCKDVVVNYPKDHLNPDHKSCWLQRLEDFEEFEEEYFSGNCGDVEDRTLTKTNSSSSIGSYNSEQIPNTLYNSKLYNDIESEVVADSIFNENEDLNTSQIRQKESKNVSLSDTICNSVVWEMLQKPYTLSLSDYNTDKDGARIHNSLSFNCDSFMCNKNKLRNVSQECDDKCDQNHLLKSENKNLKMVSPSLSFNKRIGVEDSRNEINQNINQDGVNNVKCEKLLFDDLLAESSSLNASPSAQDMFTTDNLQSSQEHFKLKPSLRQASCKCICSHHKPLLSSLTASDMSTGSTANDNLETINKLCDEHCKLNNSINQSCNMCYKYLPQVQHIDTSTSSVLSDNNALSHSNPSDTKAGPCYSDSDGSDCSSVCAETSGEVYFSEGTDCSDLPSKFLRLNPVKDNTEYCAHSTSRDKKKKVLHVRKCHRRTDSTSSDDDDDDDEIEKGKADNLVQEIEENRPQKYFLLSEILNPSTPLARFLKSHIPENEQCSGMPWENIEDGLSVESCGDGESLTGMSENSTLRSNNSLFNLNSDDKAGAESEINHSSLLATGSAGDQDLNRPSPTLRKLLNMEMQPELREDNSQYSPETWIRLVDQISLPFECAEEDNEPIVHNSTLVDSNEKSNEFDGLHLPSYDSSASCDADDEFECDCEHCQLLKSIGNTENVGTTEAETLTQTNNNLYNWPDFLEEDTNLDIDLSELRPLEPLLTNLQDIPQDLIDLMFQNVIMQMLAVHPELMGDQAPPPVPQEVIDSLPIVTTTQNHIDQEVNCPICLCPCQLGESLTILSCKHLFHPLCIQAWLSKTGTCPVCRCAVNGDTST